MNLRLGIVGSGGTGKSGLGEAIAKHFGLPFLPAKAITRKILDREGFNPCVGVTVERFLVERHLQDEILSETVAREAEYPDGFVTDRTSVDIATYAVVIGHSDADETERIVDACRLHAKTYTDILFCPWGVVPLEGNGVRTTDRWFQFAVHGTMLAFLREWGLKYVEALYTGERRVKESIAALTA